MITTLCAIRGARKATALVLAFLQKRKMKNGANTRTPDIIAINTGYYCY
jgi:hypothetical protein